MKKSNSFCAVVAAMTITIGIVMPSSNAYATGDKPVCYKWSAFENERFKLNVKNHSPLSESTEEKNFGHARQTSYSVHGKEVGFCGGDSMVGVTGTVITAKGTSHTTGQTGAHMGLEVHASRGDGSFGGEDSCRSGEFDCTTTDVSRIPTVWTCESRNEFDIYHGASTLTQVDESEDPRCSIFEDGFGNHATSGSKAVTAPSGPAGGLNVQ